MDTDLKEDENLQNVKTVSNQDLHNLLEAASDVTFQEDDRFIEGKGKFEKASSLFDLVKSDSNSHQKIRPESSEHIDYNSDSDEIEDLIVDQSKTTDIDEVDLYLNNDEHEQSDNFSKPEVDDTQLDNVVEEGVVPGAGSDVVGNESEEPETVAQQENLKSEDESENLSDEPFDQSSFDKGYQTAIHEFEKSIETEKNDFLTTANLLFEIGDEYQGLVEDILRKKTLSLLFDFLGREIEDNTEHFKNHIEACATSLISECDDFVLELNHSDLSLLQKYFTSTENKFILEENLDLRRGEFRIISGSSEYQQVLEHENI